MIARGSRNCYVLVHVTVGMLACTGTLPRESYEKTGESVQAEELRTYLDSSGVIDCAVVLPPAQFTKAELRSRGLNFLRDRPGFRLARLTVGTDPIDVDRSRRVYAIDGDPYHEVLYSLKKYGSPHHPIAQVVATRVGALLSIRDEQGWTEESIAGNADPTRFTISGTVFRLVGFFVGWGKYDSQPTQTEQKFGTIHLSFAAKGAISEALAGELWSRLRRLFGFSGLGIEIRQDYWFFADGVADFYRFADLGPFPTRSQLAVRPFIYCTSIGDGLRCRGHNLNSSGRGKTGEKRVGGETGQPDPSDFRR